MAVNIVLESEAKVHGLPGVHVDVFDKLKSLEVLEGQWQELGLKVDIKCQDILN